MDRSMKLLSKEYPEVIGFFRHGDMIILEKEDSTRDIIHSFSSLCHEYNKRFDDGPETMSQVRTFDSVKNKYLDDGLCYTCASQAAYGHQLGFSRIWPPCNECKLIVETFPIKTGNGWHRFRRGRDHDRLEALTDSA